jgi:NAD(P)-dependent dehydrogenase (short-subunit alcohol dehydrogenase family)
MKNLFDLTGKVVAITGGAGNLGTAMTVALLDYGANVAVIGRVDRLGAEFTPWREKGVLEFISRDLAEPDGARQALADVAARFGGLDVLVNNAAYGGGSGGKSCEFRLDKVDDDTWNTGIDGTLGVAFRCTRAAIPLLEERGGGAIVNIGSMYGLVAPDFAIYGDDIPWNPPSYGTGKAGLIQFTRYCAAALAPKKIRVNALTPGPFPNVTPQSDAGFIERLSNKTMLRRTGRADELAGALILLCSDASSFMTGSNIVVDGGMTSW